MAQLYDSARVRAAGETVRALRDNLEEGAMGPERRAQRESEGLKGEAAEALRERLAELERSVKAISGELGSVSAELIRYAGVLEEVGEKLSRELL